MAFFTVDFTCRQFCIEVKTLHAWKKIFLKLAKDFEHGLNKGLTAAGEVGLLMCIQKGLWSNTMYRQTYFK